MNSAPPDRNPPPAYLMRAQVMHQRLRPVGHRFVYPVFCVRIDLARAHEARNAWFGMDSRRLMSIRSRDYGARDGGDLQQWVCGRLAEAGIESDGAIVLQTFPRLFGFVFNPISLFLCHDRDGGLRAVLAEVNNTFGDTWHYLVTAPDGAVIDEHTALSSAKRMHVSPFCEVRGDYRFRLRQRGDTAMVGIDYHDDGQEQPLLRTSIGGQLRALTASAAVAALCAQPLLTIGIVVRIHWQALLLWRKRVPWFSKPLPNPPSGSGRSSDKELSS
ncbi:DUF1365 domain-containing protein [Herbaspirillum sp. alder98]|uniref:DUF1365 domain-containing protein n=1 Tax=Herbaspirillum sp. alder98 TaxID=2913096 RepID=UPI001CD847EA|nr:DUF1365 domain-containing protein [Herbaspirillum sp. alder98]MCA1324971.1 DUF1365 domain-containing protein [Herbaspirillum sp. alder98]